MSGPVVLILCLVPFILGFLIVYMSQQRRGKRGTMGGRRGLFGRSKRGGGAVPAKTSAVPSSDYHAPYYRSPEPYRPAPPACMPQPASWSGDEAHRPLPTMATGNKQAANRSKGQTICPYCQTMCDTALGTVCPECRTMHHKDCWREYGGCTILGCSQGPSKS